MTNLPWGFTNSTTLAATGAVVKRYQGPDAQERQRAEFACLTHLAGRLPVPRVRSRREDADLRTARLPGEVGTDLLMSGRGAWLFAAAGRLLRSFQEVGARLTAADVPGSGPVLAHGDFGPQNLLAVDAEQRITGLVDWEWARRSGIEATHADAAWFEWIIRYHHPDRCASLPEFFAGYGTTPAWPVRHRLMLERCGQILDFAERWDGTDGAGAVRWRERLAATQHFAPSPPP